MGRHRVSLTRASVGAGPPLAVLPTITSHACAAVSRSTEETRLLPTRPRLHGASGAAQQGRSGRETKACGSALAGVQGALLRVLWVRCLWANLKRKSRN